MSRRADIEILNYHTDPRVLAAQKVQRASEPKDRHRHGDYIVLSIPCSYLPSCTSCSVWKDSKDNQPDCDFYREDGPEGCFSCDEDTDIEFPSHYEVCHLCQGKGTVVNPSIDCGGLTAEDFDEDPDFEEAYFSGRYDQTCPTCQGKRVEAVVNVDALSPEQKAIYTKFQEYQADEDYYAWERAQERRMGC